MYLVLMIYREGLMFCTASISDKTVRASRVLTKTNSLPHSAPVNKVPKKPSRFRETGIHSYLFFSSRFHFPASLWNYSNKQITSLCRNQGACSLLALQSLPSSAPCLLFPGTIPMGSCMACCNLFFLAVCVTPQRLLISFL